MIRTATKHSSGKSTVQILAVVLLVAAAWSASAWYMQRSAPATGPLEQVTIATNTEYVGSCPVIVAQEKGYFAQHGVAAIIQKHSSGKSALEAALSGKAQLATTADIPIMFAAMKNVPVTIIATIFKTEKDHGIVGRRDSGIGAPASLKGKRIGVTLSTSGHFVLDAFLNRQRLSERDVTVRNLRPDEFAGALARGEVDAIATWEPFLGALLAQLDGNGTVFYGEDIYEIPYNIAGARDYVERHPELMKKVLRALLQGVDYCRTDPEAASAVMATALKVDTTKWKQNWPTYRFKLALDQSLLLTLEDESRWAVANGLAEGKTTPNFLNYVYLDALQAVAPSAVTVIH